VSSPRLSPKAFPSEMWIVSFQAFANADETAALLAGLMPPKPPEVVVDELKRETGWGAVFVARMPTETTA